VQRIVSVLPPGTEEAWNSYVDRRFTAAIVRDGAVIYVGAPLKGLMLSGTTMTTIVSINTPYMMNCNFGNGEITFGYGDNAVVVPIFGWFADMYGKESPPPLGIDTSSIAAERLWAKLCTRISDKLQALLKTP
jgi:hypothetical protein